MAKILVTGAAGFIGAHVASALLKRGDEVVCIDNFNDYYDPTLKEARVSALLGDYKSVWHRVDIGNIEAIKKVFSDNKFDAVCHLAAQAGVRYSLERPELYVQSNVVGTQNVVQHAIASGVTKFIFASSSSVYGNNKKLPFSEIDPVEKPISLYAATKRSGELLLHAYHSLHGLNVTCLRFFTAYGPWGRPDMAYFKFAKAIVADQSIDVYNNGALKRDFTFIDDIVSGVLLAIDHTSGFEVINLGNSHPVELGNFIEILERELGSSVKKNMMPMQPGDVLATYADITKAKSMLNWQPTTSIEEGLKKFISWFKEYYHV